MLRAAVYRGAIVGSLVFSLVGPSSGDTLEIPANHHPWGRFNPGSWSRLRETQFTTSADGGEQTTHVTVTTATLEEVADDGYTLRVEAVVDDKPSEAKTTRLAWDDAPAGLERALRLSVGEIKIGGRTVVCQTHELTSESAGVKSIDKWWYSPDQPPHLLKRILRTAGGPARFLSVETLALGVEKEILGQVLICDETKTIETFDDRASQTTAITSVSVPGGTVSSRTQIRDKQKGTVAGSRIELLEYSAVP